MAEFARANEQKGAGERPMGMEQTVRFLLGSHETSHNVRALPEQLIAYDRYNFELILARSPGDFIGNAARVAPALQIGSIRFRRVPLGQMG
jgi:hypothetical protein